MTEMKMPNLLEEAMKLRLAGVPGALPAEIEAPEEEVEDDEQEEEVEEVEEDVWRPYRNRAARRRFVKQWGQQTSSRRTRGRSLGRRPKKRALKVVEFLARQSS